MEIVGSLRRLGYIDKPSVGDHIRLFRKLDHPEGPVTIQTGVDAKHVGKSDVRRIRKRTKLKDDDLWMRVLDHKLHRSEYEQHLAAFPKSELVIEFWRDRVTEPNSGSRPKRKRKR